MAQIHEQKNRVTEEQVQKQTEIHGGIDTMVKMTLQITRGENIDY